MESRSKIDAPAHWQWVRLGDVCEINPRRPSISRSNSTLTTFVQMSAVDEIDGVIAKPGQKPFSEVKRGYTYFTEQDVIFAKITPCMENGKHAIARELTGGIGFGSTEFHVIRPNDLILAEWIWYFVRQPSVRQAATTYFTGAVGQQRVPDRFLRTLEIPLPPLAEQQHIASRLNEQMAAVAQARQAAEEQLVLLNSLVNAYFRDSLASNTALTPLSDCLVEIKQGIGKDWREYPVIGATRSGVAPAKEKVGKKPERYKLVEPGTILYNPMRINIGSIGMLDDGDMPGITSPDYVVFKSKEGMIHPRWFYYWFRSRYGEAFIKTLARGAVRERMLFNRLASGAVDLPPWNVQCSVAEKLIEIKTLKNAITSHFDEINHLPAALLRQAFTGGL